MQGMKLCISTLACPDWTLDQIIDGCVAAGIQGIDFRGIGPDLDITTLPAFTTELEQTLARLRDKGLSMPCLNTSVALTTVDAEKWNGYLEECQRYAQLAGRTSTPFVRIFGGRIAEGMSRDEGRSLALRHLRQISKICRSHGCKPVLETHDDWITSDEVLELIHELTPDEVGVLWDIQHPFTKGEAVEQTAQRLRPYLCHIHVKDCREADGQRIPTLLGEGRLPIGPAVAAARAVGYDGWWSLETERRWLKGAPEPEKSVPQFAQFMRALEAA